MGLVVDMRHLTLFYHHVVRLVQNGIVLLLFNLLYQLLALDVPLTEEFIPVCVVHALVQVEVDVGILHGGRIVFVMSRRQLREELSFVKFDF